MSKKPTKDLDQLRATAEAHLREAVRQIDESLGQHPDDDLLTRLRKQITDLLTALPNEWPFDEEDERVTALAWNSVHNIDDIFPEIGDEIGGACLAIGQASEED